MSPTEQWLRDNPDVVVYLAVLHEAERERERVGGKGARARRRGWRRARLILDAYQKMKEPKENK
jgi:hypothetical protein